MELVRWKEAVNEFLAPCCYKFAREIRICVKAVDAELKPSYMFDLAFLPCQRIIAWLKRLHDVQLVQCRLSVVTVEEQIFIVKRSVIKHRMSEISRGNERVIIVDVSRDLQQPQSTSTTLYQTIVQYSAQVGETTAIAELLYILLIFKNIYFISHTRLFILWTKAADTQPTNQHFVGQQYGGLSRWRHCSTEGCHETPHRPHRLRTGPRNGYILSTETRLFSSHF